MGGGSDLSWLLDALRVRFVIRRDVADSPSTEVHERFRFGQDHRIARNLADPDRYDLLPVVADGLGLDTGSPLNPFRISR